jgi:hypothetical protein
MLRNNWAHGNSFITTPHLPLMVLREAIWRINAIFPDAATSAWDKARAAEAEGKSWSYSYISRTRE